MHCDSSYYALVIIYADFFLKACGGPKYQGPNHFFQLSSKDASNVYVEIYIDLDMNGGNLSNF